jgi:hypothetical protein
MKELIGGWVKQRSQVAMRFDAGKVIGQHLAKLGRRCADGFLTLSQFTDALLEIEAGQVHPLGLTLSATNTLDEWTNVSIKVTGSGRPCVEFEFLPTAGKFRQLVS